MIWLNFYWDNWKFWKFPYLPNTRGNVGSSIFYYWEYHMLGRCKCLMRISEQQRDGYWWLHTSRNYFCTGNVQLFDSQWAQWFPSEMLIKKSIPARALSVKQTFTTNQKGTNNNTIPSTATACHHEYYIAFITDGTGPSRLHHSQHLE